VRSYDREAAQRGDHVRHARDRRRRLHPLSADLDSEVDGQRDDRGEEGDARRRRSHAQSPVCRRLRQQVADRGAQRAGQDVRGPEAEDHVRSEREAGDRDHPDERGEQDRPEQVPESEALRDQVSGGRPECEGAQDRDPVEGLAPAGEDRVDRQRALAREPDAEGGRQQDAEDQGAEPQRDTEDIRQVVGDQGAHDADQHDHRPVDAGVVPSRRELGDQRDGEQSAHDPRRDAQTQTQRLAEVVRESLACRGREDLDHPERERDFGHAVEQDRADVLGQRVGHADHPRGAGSEAAAHRPCGREGSLRNGGLSPV
jgi:hypothetical protein